MTLTQIRFALRYIALLLITIAASSVLGCKQVLQSSDLTPGQIVELSAEADVQIQSQYPPADPATPGLDEFNRAAAKVSANATDLPSYCKLIFQPIETSEQLSISLPDGHVFVSSGLLTLLAQDPETIDCLLAHEAGHVAMQHDLKNVTAALGQSNLNDMLAQGRYPDVVNTELELGQLSYSRNQEFEADDYAVSLVRRIGYDPKGLFRLLQLVNTQEHGTDTMTWDLSHPIGHQRLARLSRELAGHHG